MNKLFSGIKGFLIGTANVIPGVSGGTLMVIFELYERLVNAANLFLKHPIKAILSVWEILVGIFLGILGSFILLSYAYEAYPLALSLLFIGLLFGGIKPILNKLKNNFNLLNIVILIISFAVIITLPLLNSSSKIHDGFLYYLILFILGLIVAFSAIAPGISGSMMLVILGYYGHILAMGKSVFTHLAYFQFKEIIPYILPFVVLVVGFLIGVIFALKAVKALLTKFESQFYFSVTGMLFASPFAIMILLNKQFKITSFNYPQWIIGAALLFVGFALVYWMLKLETKSAKNVKENLLT
ncbi:MAG: DUF368 domain-containing protein [Acholeplasmataceae bacterium]|jgi:putative membrane protein|nr:DUF368 domain-containing protein [Acholeplasmataceae bacterium]